MGNREPNGNSGGGTVQNGKARPSGMPADKPAASRNGASGSKNTGRRKPDGAKRPPSASGAGTARGGSGGNGQTRQGQQAQEPTLDSVFGGRVSIGSDGKLKTSGAEAPGRENGVELQTKRGDEKRKPKSVRGKANRASNGKKSDANGGNDQSGRNGRRKIASIAEALPFGRRGASSQDPGNGDSGDNGDGYHDDYADYDDDGDYDDYDDDGERNGNGGRRGSESGKAQGPRAPIRIDLTGPMPDLRYICDAAVSWLLERPYWPIVASVVAIALGTIFTTIISMGAAILVFLITQWADIRLGEEHYEWYIAVLAIFYIPFLL
jgi:hypothetical protein